MLQPIVCSSDVLFTAPQRRVACIDGSMCVLGHAMQDVTDGDKEQSWGQHCTLWRTLPEAPLFAQVLFYLDFCFSVVYVLSNQFVHLPIIATLVQFQFQNSAVVSP